MDRHHRGVDRIVAILEAVAHTPGGLTLSEIARRISAPVSSAQQLLNGLVASGYVLENRRRYFLGPGAFALTMGADWSVVAPVSHGLLDRLAKELGVVVLLGVMVGDNLIYVDAAGDDPRLEYYVYNRSRRPLLDTAGGKILLASLPDAKLQERLAELQSIFSSEDVEAFVSQVRSLRQRGYSTSVAVPGSSAVGVGIAGRASGSVVAALIAVGEQEDVEGREAHVAQALKNGLASLDRSQVGGPEDALPSPGLS